MIVSKCFGQLVGYFALALGCKSHVVRPPIDSMYACASSSEAKDSAWPVLTRSYPFNCSASTRLGWAFGGLAGRLRLNNLLILLNIAAPDRKAEALEDFYRDFAARLQHSGLCVTLGRFVFVDLIHPLHRHDMPDVASVIRVCRISQVFLGHVNRKPQHLGANRKTAYQLSVACVFQVNGFMAVAARRRVFQMASRVRHARSVAIGRSGVQVFYGR